MLNAHPSCGNAQSAGLNTSFIVLHAQFGISSHRRCSWELDALCLPAACSFARAHNQPCNAGAHRCLSRPLESTITHAVRVCTAWQPIKCVCLHVLLENTCCKSWSFWTRCAMRCMVMYMCRRPGASHPGCAPAALVSRWQPRLFTLADASAAGCKALALPCAIQPTHTACSNVRAHGSSASAYS